MEPTVRPGFVRLVAVKRGRDAAARLPNNPETGCKSRDHHSLATMATVTDSVARILAEHGPLHEDAIVELLRDSGETVPDRVVDELIHPAGELIDERWVWLPTLLAGRVFTHRLDIDELTHDLLIVTPDLDPITTLCEHAQYQRLADGSPVQIVVEGYDDELLDQRGIPPGLAGRGSGTLDTWLSGCSRSWTGWARSVSVS